VNFIGVASNQTSGMLLTGASLSFGSIVWVSKINHLEHVAIAMHCNSRPPDGAPVLVRFNHDAHAKFEVTQPIRCRLIAFLLLTR